MLGPAPRSLESIPGELDDYELLEEIGRGGQGVVYRARQKSLNRQVALKVLSLGHHFGDAHLKRFRLEAEAAASLDHPGIVPIYEIAEHKDYCYFSMKLVEGKRLDRGAEPPSEKDAVQLAIRLARIVHYAHQRGVLHRDIKPANILLDENGGPHLADFGLAKLVEQESSVTNTADVLGTPSYMAPEQASGDVKQISIATDVYGLGAVLYYLLTGAAPFAGGTTYETIRLVRETEPRRPSLLNPRARGDLETICLKCLCKEPARRYSSAEALAQDLERFSRGEPILARPASPAEKFLLWCRRKPIVATLAGATLLSALVIAVGLPVATLKIARQREVLRHNLYASDINAAHRALLDHNLGLTMALLQKHQPRSSKGIGGQDLRGWEWRYLWQQASGDEAFTLTNNATTTCALFSADGKLVATGGHDRTVRVFDVATKKELVSFGPLAGSIDTRALAFSPDNRLLAAKAGRELKVWETAQWQLVSQLSGEPNWTWNDAVAFSPDNTTLATRTSQGLCFWDTRTWKVRFVLPVPHHYRGDSSNFGRSLSYSADRQWLAISYWGEVLLFKPDELTEPRTTLSRVPGSTNRWDRVVSTDFSTAYLAVGYRDGMLRLWDRNSWKLAAEIRAHASWCSALAFSPDGAQLATGGSDQVIRLWQCSPHGSPAGPILEPFATLQGHRQTLSSVAYSPTTADLVSTSADRTVKFWNQAPRPRALRIVDAGYPLWVSGADLVTSDPDHRVRVRDAQTGQVRKELQPAGGEAEQLIMSSSGKYLAISRTSSEIELWDVPQDKLQRRVPGLKASQRLQFSPQEDRIAAATGSTVCLWTLLTGREEARFALSGPIAFSSNGRVLAGVGPKNQVQLWDIDRRKLIRSFPPQIELIHRLAFSPKADLLAVAVDDGTLHLWNSRTGQEEHVIYTHDIAPWRLAFHPDGRTLLCSTADNILQLWHVQTGQELLSLNEFNPGRSMPVFSADGNSLACVGNSRSTNAEVKVWHELTLAEIDARAAR